jgi:sporulation protein YlmC with PRC-barrel domain
MMKTLSAALVGVALIAAPAIAQNANPDAKMQPQASKASQNEQNASATGLWQGSKLIGLNVYNNNNEKIGDIKQLMVNKSGQIDDVVIGVGGFLGMGERDVAVKFSELKWVNEPVRKTSTSSNRPGGLNQLPGATTGSNSGSANSANSAGNANSAKSNPTYPDHAMLEASKEQLQAMPQFNYNK